MALRLGFIAALSATTLAGLPYYTLDVATRVRSPLHAWFRPSGHVGQTAGLLAFALFVFLWLYPLRKCWRWLAFTGSIGRWLDVHIFAGLTIPWLAAIHAAWRFEGLIGLGYGAMLLVCASGIVGKYIYSHLPRSRSGVELTKEEVSAERARLVGRIAAATRSDPREIEAALVGSRGGDAGGTSPLRTLVRLLSGDLSRWRVARRLRRLWGAGDPARAALDDTTLREVLRLARREMRLGQQARMLEATQRVFRFWHVAHRPIAVTALGAVLLHVAVVVAVGATWLR